MNGPLAPDFFPPSALPFVPGSTAGSDPHYGGLLGACIVAAGLLVLASLATPVIMRALAAGLAHRTTLPGARNLTPEGIVAYRSPARVKETPALVSRRIVERSEEIRRALRAEPSDIEVTMCALGYSACTDDLLALAELAGERLPGSGPVRRLMMCAALRRASDSLARTRKALREHDRVGPFSGGTRADAE